MRPPISHMATALAAYLAGQHAAINHSQHDIPSAEIATYEESSLALRYLENQSILTKRALVITASQVDCFVKDVMCICRAKKLKETYGANIVAEMGDTQLNRVTAVLSYNYLENFCHYINKARASEGMVTMEVSAKQL
ncbi:hypothetical protein F5Y15DRAFT_414618 [Xylariaceae sp. FL0016]|nr:hypothetical protein F5Y15DRAFT_414618 [Xylariaceae sp. FL0016]